MSSQPPIAASETVDEKIERLLFGDDLKATTPDDLYLAVQSYLDTFGAAVTERLVLTDAAIAKPAVLRIWENRSTVAWKNEMEQHVAAYRRKARPFSTDPAMMMKVIEEMKNRGLRMVADMMPDGWTVFFRDSRNFQRPGVRYHESFTEAVALAAAAALEGI